jgi:TolA-binding protein
MAEKLGILDQMLFGKWADRAAINRHADDLSNVEANLTELRKFMDLQAQEILRLRAMLMGVVEVLHTKAPFDDAELELAIQAAWTKLTAPPPPPQQATDPYRNVPVEASAEDIAAAKALLASAQDHHFSQRFADARTVYQQIIDQHPNTKQAATARQQLANLRKA